MKKLSLLVIAAVLLPALASCQGSENDRTPDGATVSTAAAIEEQNKQSNTDDIIDLTKLSSTMVYSEVYNMTVAPDSYIGKTVRMQGTFAVYEDPQTENRYYACIIADATACCSQGLEFVLAGENSYPDDYPESGKEITVTGVFDTYEENGALYCHLKDASLG